MMNNNESFTLVDVRTESEYRSQRIDGAILIPVDQIESQAPSKLPDKEAKIVVYCRSGARSSVAARKLVTLGYTNVYDLGGIMNWPYETVSG